MSSSMKMLSPDDLYLFNEGRHFRMYDKFGAHLSQEGGRSGTRFTVWAPAAESVAVIGDFNGWSGEQHRLEAVGSSGCWSGFFAGIEKGTRYKYRIRSRHAGYQVDKADPLGFMCETPPLTASVVWDQSYEWRDEEWMKSRSQRQALDKPWSIYELHMGSWARKAEEDNRSLSYREMAEKLPSYLLEQGFTHVEFMPIMEHPFYGSWGYQVTGYFAPTSRYGMPQDLMFLIDALHQAGIGVIFDWVPSHFPSDEHGLSYFDGTHLYEHADRRQGFHPDWNSLIFNYGRNEVRSFLISSALYWLDRFHVDGLRVDAVASMLYLDYSRKAGEWIPNKYGGRENLEAIDLLKQMNEAAYSLHPGIQTIAEESTAWPRVSHPTYLGGLGFGMKWDMGWMHDTLDYFRKDPVFRKYHQGQLTFRMIYAFNENFVLSLSHDEVVYGKGSLIGKMTGDAWQNFANLRALYGYMYAQPGKKLLFMGCEFGQWQEWAHERSLDWHLLNDPPHRNLLNFVRDLNGLYKSESALHDLDFKPDGFEWVDANDAENSILSFLRKSADGKQLILAVFNLTPQSRQNYRIGVPMPGFWREILNSDADVYGGSGMGNYGGREASVVPNHGRPYSLNLTLPPLSTLYFKWEGEPLVLPPH